MDSDISGAGDHLRRYPSLFAPGVWGSLRVQFSLTGQLPTDLAIANVNIVPFVDDRVVVVRLSNGRVEMPGGTLEPGEDYLDAARRELREEAGAMLHSFSPIGWWHCCSTDSVPFRPHIPHPRFARLVGLSDITITNPPSHPPGSEHVISVEALSVSEAAERFAANNRPDIADLYHLASTIRGLGTPH